MKEVTYNLGTGLIPCAENFSKVMMSNMVSKFSISLVLAIGIVVETQVSELPLARAEQAIKLSRVSPNLVTNAAIAGQTPWFFLDGATYDPTVSRGADGSGSIKLGPEGSRILTKTISVVPGRPYIYSAFIKDNGTLPGLVEMFVQVRTNTGTFKRNSIGSRQGVPEMDKWYESSIVFIPEADEFSVQLYAVRKAVESPGQNNVLWLDDIYFGEGIGFAEAATLKKAFNGSMTRVDDLGNIEVSRGNSWNPFFPLCIYADNKRPDWTVYSEQGFNCNMWASSAPYVQKAKDATSSFNPNGMMSGFEIAAYTSPIGWAYKDYDGLRRRLKAIIEGDLCDSMLLYYWDNENSYDAWEIPKVVTDIIKQADTDKNGQRMHPIYALQGNHGISRMYNNSTIQMTDIVGTYATGHNGGVGGSPAGLVILNNVVGQDNPVVFAQVNYGVGAKFRATIYEALIQGAKGIGFWRDTYKSELRPSVESLPWWSDLPNIRREIDKLFPLIRESPWTDWSLTHQDASIEVGTRDYNGEGYVILVNKSTTKKTVSFEIKGLSYKPHVVQDYFTAKEIAEISDETFTVTLPGIGSGHESAVYRLVPAIGEADDTPPLSPSGVSIGVIK